MSARTSRDRYRSVPIARALAILAILSLAAVPALAAPGFDNASKAAMAFATAYAKGDAAGAADAILQTDRDCFLALYGADLTAIAEANGDAAPTVTVVSTADAGDGAKNVTVETSTGGDKSRVTLLCRKQRDRWFVDLNAVVMDGVWSIGRSLLTSVRAKIEAYRARERGMGTLADGQTLRQFREAIAYTMTEQEARFFKGADITIKITNAATGRYRLILKDADKTDNSLTPVGTLTLTEAAEFEGP